VPETGAIRVLIAYGDKLARTGLCALLNVEPDIAVAGSAADGEGAIAQAVELDPDVLLIDMALPGMSAVEVTRRILADPRTAGARVLILSASEQQEEVFSSLRAGATGLLSRDTEPTGLVDGIRAVAAGGAALSPAVVRSLIDELASQPDPGLPGPEQLDELTSREREVMALVATGLSNDQIAQRLVVTPATAKTHVSRALMKLRARNRAQLVTLAYETGLVLPKQHRASTPVVPARALAVA
jgi:DNA-binding NarL/FixJ family response regulator